MVTCPDIPAVTHQDGTSRLQTVTLTSHAFIYALLSELHARGKIPILLNTSFNIRGQPILTRLKDAFFILDTTELDGIVTEHGLFLKK